jgi:two-component system, OmpR family, sensor histidine kinase ChvG
MTRLRIALGIRAQLLLVLTVFLAIPWLGYEYVQELERFLRDAQERTLAGTAQAVAAALHGRARLFDVQPAPRETPAADRDAVAAPSAARLAIPHPGAMAETAEILQGLSRTTARIWIVDRNLNVLARTGSLKHPAVPLEDAANAGAGPWIERNLLHPFYARVLSQPTEDFSEDSPGRTLREARDVQSALAGILTTDRRPTPDGRAVIVSAAHPIWVGDEVKGAVIVEETANAVLAERNRAFERLFTIVVGTLLVGSVALTLFASRLSARIRRLRDDAERAIDAHGRVKEPLAGSSAGDEIGDLSRSFSSVLARLSQFASYQENMASRLSHELRTPVAVVRSSLDNLKLNALPDDARVYIDRAQGGLNRLTAILTRMTEATRLEQSLGDVERERVDLAKIVAGCVDGYRNAYSTHRFVLDAPSGELLVDVAPDLIAQMLDKLVANAGEFAPAGTPVVIRLALIGDRVRIGVENEGPPLPEGMRGRLFDSMVSVRRESGGDVPHLGLGLYIVRLIAEFHGGRAAADDLDDGRGVVVAVTLPRVLEGAGAAS